MPGGFNLKSIITGAVDGLGNSISKVIDSINAPKEIKQQIQGAIDQQLLEHRDNVLQIGEQHEEAILADNKNARETNVAIQISDKPSWLAKNLPYCLAMFISIIWGAVTLYIIARFLRLLEADPKIDMTSVMAMYTSISGLEMMILTFYFGSTHSSKDKDATIATMAANQ